MTETKLVIRLYHKLIKTSTTGRGVKALPTSDHGFAGSSPAGGESLPEPKRRFIAQSLSCSPFHLPDMIEILLKGTYKPNASSLVLLLVLLQLLYLLISTALHLDNYYYYHYYYDYYTNYYYCYYFYYYYYKYSYYCIEYYKHYHCYLDDYYYYHHHTNY